jgi:LPS O-antigen subunit length determinant protein (WzzB/FepE family)
MTKRHDPPAASPPFAAFPPYIVYREEETLDLAAYWRVVVERRLLVGAIAVVATLIAVVTALTLPPVYRAEVLLAPAEQEKAEGLGALSGPISDLAALAGASLGPAKDKTAEFIAALKSRAFSVSFIKEQNLMPVLFADSWDKEKKTWKDAANPPTEWSAYERWDKSIRQVNVDRRSGLITLAIEWRDPVRAAKWANELVHQANARLRAEAVDEASRNIAYLEKQLAQTSTVEVQQAIYRLIEAQTKKKMLASTRGEYAFTVIDPAVPPGMKYKPNRTAIVYAGLLLGLVLGVAAAIIVGRRRDAEAGEPQG